MHRLAAKLLEAEDSYVSPVKTPQRKHPHIRVNPPGRASIQPQSSHDFIVCAAHRVGHLRQLNTIVGSLWDRAIKTPRRYIWPWRGWRVFPPPTPTRTMKGRLSRRLLERDSLWTVRCRGLPPPSSLRRKCSIRPIKRISPRRVPVAAGVIGRWSRTIQANLHPTRTRRCLQERARGGDWSIQTPRLLLRLGWRVRTRRMSSSICNSTIRTRTLKRDGLYGRDFAT